MARIRMARSGISKEDTLDKPPTLQQGYQSRSHSFVYFEAVARHGSTGLRLDEAADMIDMAERSANYDGLLQRLAAGDTVEKLCSTLQQAVRLEALPLDTAGT